MTKRRRRKKRRNYRANKAIEMLVKPIVEEVGGSPLVGFTTLADGSKRMALRVDFDIPPEIDDRILGPDDNDRIQGFARSMSAVILAHLAEHGITGKFTEANFTYAFPPMSIVTVDYDENGNRFLRPMTEEEVIAALNDPSVSSWTKNEIRYEWQHRHCFEWHYDPDVPLDECWKCVRYAGIAVNMEATVPSEVVKSIVMQRGRQS